MATTTIGPDAIPPTSATSADVNPSAQALRELHDSVAGQYGSRSASDTTVNPSARVRRELRDSVAGQYGQAAGERNETRQPGGRAAARLPGRRWS